MSHDRKKLIAMLRRYANKDLKIVDERGAMTICKTKIGNINVTKEGPGYRLRSYSANALGEVIDHGLMGKKGAVLFIMNSYDVVDENNNPIEVAV